MRKLVLIPIALMAGSLALNGAAAQQGQQQSSGGEMEVTGIVTDANEQAREFTINEQTFFMPEEGGGAALFPAEGDEVTLYYRKQGGRKVITRIGQPRSKEGAQPHPAGGAPSGSAGYPVLPNKIARHRGNLEMPYVRSDKRCWQGGIPPAQLNCSLTLTRVNQSIALTLLSSVPVVSMSGGAGFRASPT